MSKNQCPEIIHINAFSTYQTFYLNGPLFKIFFEFGFALPTRTKPYFLIALSAFAWTIWTSRNNTCFQHTPVATVRYDL